jgi:hypothetical protein
MKQKGIKNTCYCQMKHLRKKNGRFFEPAAALKLFTERNYA